MFEYQLVSVSRDSAFTFLSKRFYIAFSSLNCHSSIHNHGLKNNVLKLNKILNGIHSVATGPISINVRRIILWVVFYTITPTILLHCIKWQPDFNLISIRLHRIVLSTRLCQNCSFFILYCTKWQPELNIEIKN